MGIEYFASKRLFVLSTTHTTYAFYINAMNVPVHLYYGRHVSDNAELLAMDFSADRPAFSPHPEKGKSRDSNEVLALEFSGDNSGDFRVTGVRVVGENGDSASDAFYTTHRMKKGKYAIPGLPAAHAAQSEAETLELELEDSCAKARYILYYSVFDDEDVITRAVRIINISDGPVRLERMMSAQIDFPVGDYDLLSFHGSWARERHAERLPLGHGVRSIRSCRGASSHASNPCVALMAHDATEMFGDVYGFALVYSGNFAIEAELGQYDTPRITLGIDPGSFCWHLEPGEDFYTPEAVLGYSAEGLNGLSRNFHDFVRNHILNAYWSRQIRPILINNWEATYFDFNADKLREIGKMSSELGIEMLVLDDGWFGKRDTDNCSLGDWVVNQEKLGNFETLVSDLNRMKLKFGLWFEPEMVSPDSDLYRAHPEWTLHTPGRQKMIGRTQYILDFSRDEVADYIYEAICKILSTVNVEYVKWDMNRNMTEVFSAALPPERQGEVAHRYIKNVYRVLARLIQAFPHLLIEGCSGGGGRFDLGMLYYTPQIWCSDDSDAIERLSIQAGTSCFYPASTMGAHVSVCPNHQTGRVTPFTTRGYVAQCGTFGYELDPTKLSEEDRMLIREQIATYHRSHDLVVEGDLYRLTPCWKTNPVEGMLFVGKAKRRAMMVIVRRQAVPCGPNLCIKLAGLVPELRYRTGDGHSFYGDTLMNCGYPLEKLEQRDGASLLVELEAE
ncbi:MAG: alpha-galactosidase [Victivallaceae bacterium]|nr:alpha-galactosidase [Victivallaceae bacterium]